ncbi:ABC transporter-MRP, partial [Thraustotheca clavata]
SVFIGGKIAYFSQQPWIQNLTIRDNILFGKPYDRKKYNSVLEACALTKDLCLFAAGDRTEIGQKGVNLSGGQKARISLARACYSDADIFVLDSPLSAVDAIVQNEIFTKCFLGLLQNKTVLLVTHSPEIIESNYIDRTIQIKDGQLISTPVDRQEYETLISPLSSGHELKLDNQFDLEPVAPQHHSNVIPQVTNSDLILTPTTPVDFVSVSPFSEATTQSYDEEKVGKLIFDEARSQGRVASKIFSAYFKAIGGLPNVLSWVILLSFWQVLAIGSDFWLSKWSATANVVTKQEFLKQAKYYLEVYAALSLGGVVFTFLRTISVLMSGLNASRILFNDMTKALLRAPMNFFDTNPLGRILNRYSSDMTTVDTQIPDILNSMLTMASMAAFALGTTIVVIRLYGLLVIPLLFIYLYVGYVYVQPAREIERVNKTTKSPMLNLISECIEGALVIRASGQRQVHRFQCLHHRNVDGNLAAIYVNSVFGQWFAMRIQLTTALLLLVIAISLVFSKDYISPGVIGLILNYAFSILPFFEWIVQCWSTIETSMIGPERLAEYAAIESEAPRVISGATSYDWPTSGHITFTNMSFRYKENDPLVLKNINLDIQPGEKIGIVGRTGAGKSSLTMALFRISELATGTITIDGIDISRIGVKTLRTNISIIPQSPVLFRGTLRNYLDPFGDYSDEQLWEALRKVHIHERIASVNGELDSAVEENGENFSVGERQMLCMSRALLRQTRIVVMDEATAAIDHTTDHILQRVIRAEFASSTVLTIAHRLDTVLDCDRIAVFGQGRLVQCDQPQKLISAGEGIFFDLCSEGGYLDKINLRT